MSRNSSSTSNYLTGTDSIGSAFTVSFWGNPSTNGFDYHEFLRWTGGTNLPRCYIWASEFYYETTSASYSNAKGVSLNVWQHFTARYGSGNIAVAVNASFTADKAMTAPSDDYSNIQILGGSVSWTRHIRGLAVWDTTLSDAQVDALYRGRSPLLVAPSNLQRFWPMSGVSTGAEVDLIAGDSASETGTVGAGLDATTLGGAFGVRGRPLFKVNEDAAAGGFSVPIHSHHRYHNLAI